MLTFVISRDFVFVLGSECAFAHAPWLRASQLDALATANFSVRVSSDRSALFAIHFGCLLLFVVCLFVVCLLLLFAIVRLGCWLSWGGCLALLLDVVLREGEVLLSAYQEEECSMVTWR